MLVGGTRQSDNSNGRLPSRSVKARTGGLGIGRSMMIMFSLSCYLLLSILYDIYIYIYCGYRTQAVNTIRKVFIWFIKDVGQDEYDEIGMRWFE